MLTHSNEDAKRENAETGNDSCAPELVVYSRNALQSLHTDKSGHDDSESAQKDHEEAILGRLLNVTRGNRKLRKFNGGMFTYNGKILQIRIPMTTPLKTISSLTFLVLDDLINQPNLSSSNGIRLYKNKSELQHAGKMIRKAFVEIYKEMDYLRRYRTLNLLAFKKILKKFDRLNHNKAQFYIKEVESSYFNQREKIEKLMNEIEELFMGQIAEDDHKKTMKYLKPHCKKKSHIMTFFTGLFAGSFFALLVGYSSVAHIARLYTRQPHSIYMETTYPILSIFGLLFLHFFLYGLNIIMWKRARINYSFIFEFNPSSQLKYNDVFMSCAASMTIVVGVMFFHSFLTYKGLNMTQVQTIPGFLILLFLMVLLCPMNVIYYSSRYLFLKVLRNIVFAPFYKVVMIDFFVADQLCSQVPMLRDLAQVSCYYITGSYKIQDFRYCMRSKSFRHLPYIISFFPYYWRAMQCFRRWYDEKQACHLVNMGKYVSAMLAASTYVAYDNDRSIKFLFILVTMSSIATVYQLYWDFVKDWGLLQLNSKNPWLRSELMLKWKLIYFLSMGLNLILRLAWLHTILHFKFGSADQRLTSFFFATLEVIRRAQGNFYRLENENLNNAGNFRAVKAVPLPFHEVDEE